MLFDEWRKNISLNARSNAYSKKEKWKKDPTPTKNFKIKTKQTFNFVIRQKKKKN